jgi:HEAT repeat protein
MIPRSSVVALSLLLTIPLATAFAASARPDDERRVAALLSPHPDIEAIRALGPGVLPALAGLYERSDETRRMTIAWTLYSLGWKSEQAERALMRDARSSNVRLRLQVQSALGRVSSDPEVVDVFLENVRDDDGPMYRDKAAVTLASNQVHLTEDQRFRVYERLIAALADPSLQVRQSALRALQFQTGQTKNFDPAGSPKARESALGEWQRWLQAYRSNM